MKWEDKHIWKTHWLIVHLIINIIIKLTKLISINAIIRKFMYILMAIVKSGNSFDEEKAIRESCIIFS